MARPTQGRTPATKDRAPQPYDDAGHSEEEDEAGADGSADGHGPDQLPQGRGGRLVGGPAGAEVEADVGGQHGESAGVDGRHGAGGQGESQGRQAAAEEALGVSDKALDEPVDHVAAAVLSHHQRPDDGQPQARGGHQEGESEPPEGPGLVHLVEGGVHSCRPIGPLSRCGRGLET